ncbi:tryptophan transporter [Halobacillus sp. ACCC02827]|uniref:tryptophan transporter n=1 Tax=Bacillaceae TaxID=186817 RepID=UPI0002A51128|nr:MULTISPECIES: tryptophan transporter [Bacillaceae]ELK47660.1 tryptophan transport protein [Halobacillus sp. BAB-2008]QHT45970.1 tryptophan transporter [Bacillus sp. SB49]WJE16782.1 tryptophan transporter [Halobacillus sp. ACCC02827]
MNIRVLVMLSLLVGIGAVLHAVAPPFFFGMRPDMMLAMMFLGILMFPKVPYVLLISLATAFISALTTTAPGGQLANIIDKPVTAFAFFALVLMTKKISHHKVTQPVLAGIGTMISGSIFLAVVLYIIGLMDASFGIMFATVVLPATAFNILFIAVVYPIATKIMKRTSIAKTAAGVTAK